MSEYVKLADAPPLVLNNPDCGMCATEVESDGDGWLCPSCGTTWDYASSDGDTGTLYEEWSGETLGGEPVPADADWTNSPQLKAKADELRKARNIRLWGCEHGFTCRESSCKPLPVGGEN